MRMPPLSLAIVVLALAACDEGERAVSTNHEVEGPAEASFVGDAPDATSPPQATEQPATMPTEAASEQADEPPRATGQADASPEPAPAPPAEADPADTASTVEGRILDIGRVNPDADEPRIAARLETAEGDVVVVDLGPARPGLQPRFQPGDRIRVRGRLLADKQPHPVLIASRIAPVPPDPQP